MNNYLITYYFSRENGKEGGIADTTIALSDDIFSSAAIENIRKYICKKYNVETCVIMNIIKLNLV